jgi:hypothetical protein
MYAVSLLHAAVGYKVMNFLKVSPLKAQLFSFYFKKDDNVLSREQ